MPSDSQTKPAPGASKEQPGAPARAPRFESLTRLATGGMAEIWLARELGAAGFERFVVIKRLLPHLARDRGVVEMFASEARFVARLVHPNVVQIHELGEDDEGYFLVMEYVAGCSVRELTGAARKANETLSPDIAVCIVEQACRGVHAAHELRDPSGRPLGLVHRDISPHNLMIGPHGDVKLLDFGIAKATETERTHTGSLKGKHGYMSPEQCRARPLDRRSDVFAMGIVLWELLVGQRLFDRGSDFDSLQAIVHGDVRPPSEVNPGLPSAFDAVVMKALAGEVEQRWQTADELRRALSAVAEQEGVRPSRDALAAKLAELLGDRIEQRNRSLRDVADASARADEEALHEVLVGSASGKARAEPPSGPGTVADDVPTVVEHRAPRVESSNVFDEESATGDERTAMETTRTIGASAPAPPAALPRPAGPASPRRLLLGLAAALAFAAALLVLARLVDRGSQPASSPSASGRPALAGPALRFVVAPTVDRDVMVNELAPFARWLEDKLGRPVEVDVAQSYRESGDLVASGRADLGLLPPLLYLQTAAREPRLVALALRLYEGSRGSDGYLLTRDDAPVSSARDLRGRTACLIRESTTGFLLPRIWMREAGLDPDKDVQTFFSEGHLAALRDLTAHKCDAAAIYSGAYLSARQEGIEVGGTRVLAITGRAPQDVIAAAPSLPDAEARRLREALLGFDPKRDIDAPTIGAVLGISGFAAFDAAEFERIRIAADREGLLRRTP